MEAGLRLLANNVFCRWWQGFGLDSCFLHQENGYSIVVDTIIFLDGDFMKKFTF